MTLFEYLAIAFSLVLSFAAMRLIGGLPHALDPARSYWVHITLVFLLLFGTAFEFWVLWSYRDVDWNLPRFLLVLANPALMYFLACVLVPEVPSSIESWRNYYFAISQRYFAGLCVWGIAVLTASTVVLDVPLAHPARGPQSIFLAAGILGFASRNPRVHAGIAALFICFLPLLALWIGLRPGFLAR